MIEFDLSLFQRWLSLFAFPLSRIFGFVASAPIWATGGLPKQIRLMLDLSMVLCLAPVIPETQIPNINPASGHGLEILATQMLVGICMGLSARIIFAAVDVAGEYIGYQMGLGFATFYDPIDSAQTPVMAELLTLIGILLFLAFNGHLMYVLTLSKSFTIIPVSDFANTFGVKNFAHLANLGSIMFSLGLSLCMPVVITLLVFNVALGVLTRASPQLNIFALGFPITLLGGFILMWFSMHTMMPFMEHIFSVLVDSILAFINPNVVTVPVAK